MKTKTFLIIEIIILIIALISYFMAYQGLFREMLGTCGFLSFASCLSGHSCSAVMNYCSETIGKILLIASAVAFISVLIIFIVRKILKK